MWTRAELKAKARANLKRYYWAAFAVSLVFMIVSAFTGGDSSGTGGNTGFVDQGGNAAIYEEYGNGGFSVGQLIDNIHGGIGGSGTRIGRIFWTAYAGVMIFFVLAILVLSVFVTSVMQVGKNRFYLESRLAGASAGVGKLGWGFSHSYLKIVGTMFLMGLLQALPVLIPAVLMLVIGGIGGGMATFILGMALMMAGACVEVWLSYCWWAVPYILAENPDMRLTDVLRLSKDMMNGQKFSTFVLQFSFIGWYLLGLLACGVGILFVSPYYEAAMAELYAVLRKPYRGQLNGFGYPEEDEVVYDGGYGQDDRNPYYGDNGNGGFSQGGTSSYDGDGSQNGQ